jgi:drug/metabolite transporter (DMT)-like permease
MKHLWQLEKRGWQWFMLLLLSLMWGSSFILMKRGLESFTPWQVAAMRIFFAFLLTLPFIRKSLKYLNRRTIGPLLVVSLIGNGLTPFLFTLAQVHIDSLVAGILNSLTPLMTLVVGLLFFGSRVRPVNVAGLFIALGGTWLLLSGGQLSLVGTGNAWGLLIVLATVCYGFNVNFVKTALTHIPAIRLVSLIFLFVGPPAAIFLAFSGLHPSAAQSGALLDMFFVFLLALTASALAVTLFNELIKFTSAIFAASVTYIIPIFAIMWGVIDGEPFGWQKAIWIGLILFGVYLVNLSKKK